MELNPAALQCVPAASFRDCRPTKKRNRSHHSYFDASFVHAGHMRYGASRGITAPPAAGFFRNLFSTGVRAECWWPKTQPGAGQEAVCLHKVHSKLTQVVPCHQCFRQNSIRHLDCRAEEICRDLEAASKVVSSCAGVSRLLRISRTGDSLASTHIAFRIDARDGIS